MADDAKRKHRRLPEILAAVGFFVSLLLQVVHVRTYLFAADSSYCTVGETLDCAAVAASPTSVFLGLPIATWGALGFLSIWLALRRRSPWVRPLTLVAALASVALLAVELLVVGALCFLCEIVHIVSWTLLVVAWRLELENDWKSRDDLLTVFGFPGLLLGALSLAVPHYWGAFHYRSQPPFPTGTTKEGHPWIGSPNPSLTVHEFIDYRCPHCRIASVQSLALLDENRDWRLVRRHFPRTRCPEGSEHACRGVRLAYCAAEQDEFWRADRWLFAHFNPRKEFDPADFAQDLGLDSDELESCLTRPDIYERAAADARTARQLRLGGTPAYLVDGQQVSPSELRSLD